MTFWLALFHDDDLGLFDWHDWCEHWVDAERSGLRRRKRLR